ncbi:MAG: iron ABC transporter permease [Acidobacteria bacterium]|nr:iron ABC transporter permease [Acidobacteriota bacterium]
MMWGFRSARTPALAAAVAAFTVLCGLPLAYMLAQAGAAGAAYAVLLLDARQRALLLNTAALGASTAVLATLIGAPLGFALARVPLRFRSVWRVALAAPLLLPPYVIALAWVYLGGSAGLVAAAVGRDVVSAWTYSLPGAVVVLSLVFYPLSMLTTEVALRRIEPRIEEAALTAASPGRVLRTITLPLVTPAVAASALVVFVLAVSEFGVPSLLRVRVFTSEIFTAFAALYDFSRATVLALPLVTLSFVVALLATLLVGDRLLVTRRGGGSASPLAYEGWTRRAAAAASGVMVIALVVPVVVLAREASGVASLAAVIRGSGEAIRTSLALAALGATLVTAVAVWVGYARGRASRRAGAAADVLLIVLFAVPSTVVGVGLIGVWNRPGPLGSVYGTDGMLLLGYLARFLPVAALALAAGVRYVPASHEEAAAVGGAGWWQTMTRIVLPQLRLTAVAAWTIVFILAFGELGTSVLVAPPGESTLPIRIYTMIANAPSAEVAALALLQSGVVLVPLALLACGIAARPGR